MGLGVYSRVAAIQDDSNFFLVMPAPDGALSMRLRGVRVASWRPLLYCTRFERAFRGVVCARGLGAEISPAKHCF